MKQVLVIGSGISGLSCAIACAQAGNRVQLVAPYPSERAQSVMAAGGINAVLDDRCGDSVEAHIQDTYKSGCRIENLQDIAGLCGSAGDIVRWLDSIGVVFSRKDGQIAQRAFGGQSFVRTCYAGSATGKQIVSALVFQCRQYEAQGQITRIFQKHFYSALIQDGRCCGVLLLDELTGKLEQLCGDAVVMATGGQNALFGKTTGSTLCDGYAAGKLFTQGVRLRNLEFVQYHPTTIETPHKRMLISEAARGEGGRLYYLENGKRVYFMEDKFGPKGNLMPRDIVAKCIYDAPSQVYLDITFLGEQLISQRLSEIRELCKRYADLDVTQESIPVYPSVHFFMGGIDVDEHHRTNIANLYAVGEAASKYHGANRLGGNSLLAALYSGKKAAEHIQTLEENASVPDFQDTFDREQQRIAEAAASKSQFPHVYLEQEIARILNENLGITRQAQDLQEGLENIDFYIAAAQRLHLDPQVSVYRSIRVMPMLILAKALLLSALSRQESRGAHLRVDFPDAREEFRAASIAEYRDGAISITYRKEDLQ